MDANERLRRAYLTRLPGLPPTPWDGRVDMEARTPARGCLLALAACCFFWAGVFAFAAYLWGWI